MPALTKAVPKEAAETAKYPKPLMRISEMVKLGIPRTELEQAVHIPKQTFARKSLGGGVWIIDTAAYEKEMQRRCKRT